METTGAIKPHAPRRPQALMALCSTAVLFFLFFIDEGAYNLDWMLRAGNWLAFFIYLLIFVSGQYTMYYWILSRYKGRFKILLANVLGMPLGFLLILLLIFVIANLQA